MNAIRAIAALAATTAAVCVAAPDEAAGTGAASTGRASAVRRVPVHPHSAAASAARELRANDVPSTRNDPATLKARADADLAARGVAPAAGPHLHAERENLKGPAAAAEIARRRKPSTYDRDIANGDIDHTEQVTDLKITVKK
ncbi:MAG: hypothetical protein ACTHL8_22740 [Burkholderiaceae bacterium]